jgi:MFS family permease
LLKDIGIGFQYLGANPQVLMCLIFGMLPLLVAMPAQFFMVIFANDVWQVGQEGLGYMIAAMGLGGILGSFFAARLHSGSGRMKYMLISALLCAVAFAGFSQPIHYYVALVFLVGANAGAIACQTISNVSLQLLVDDRIRGRVTSFTMMSFGLTPFIAFPIEIGIKTLGPSTAFFMASIILFGVILLMYLLSSSLRRLDAHIAESYHAQKANSEK